MRPRSAASRRHLSSSPFNVQPDPEPLETFSAGDRVSHDTYGLGRVVAVDSHMTLLVEFGARRLRMVAPYAKLIRL
jgi:transcription elongation factor GreA-like protein